VCTSPCPLTQRWFGSVTRVAQARGLTPPSSPRRSPGEGSRCYRRTRRPRPIPSESIRDARPGRNPFPGWASAPGRRPSFPATRSCAWFSTRESPGRYGSAQSNPNTGSLRVSARYVSFFSYATGTSPGTGSELRGPTKTTHPSELPEATSSPCLRILDTAGSFFLFFSEEFRYCRHSFSLFLSEESKYCRLHCFYLFFSLRGKEILVLSIPKHSAIGDKSVCNGGGSVCTKSISTWS